MNTTIVAAAEVGLALERANAVLTTLAACYDSKLSRFVVNDEFLVHAIASIETFVGQARKSLSGIEDGTAQQQANSKFATSFELLNATKTPPIQPEQSEHFAIGFAEEPMEEPLMLATSYDELMRKVTAAEVFAVEGQSNHHSPTNAALLPLLKSLRSDLQKMRVA